MDDLISRQDAIDALMPIYKSASLRNRNVFSTARKCMAVIEEIPSAQPENIRCKDCKFYEIYPNGANGDCINRIDAFNTFYPNDFCSYGERKDEGL